MIPSVFDIIAKPSHHSELDLVPPLSLLDTDGYAPLSKLICTGYHQDDNNTVLNRERRLII